MTMPAVTLWQPWASLVAAGVKPFEFRLWPAPTALVGRRLAIHAGSRSVSRREVRELLVRLHTPHWPTTGLQREPAILALEAIMRSPSIVPLGAVVCCVTLGRPAYGGLLNRAVAAAIGQPPEGIPRDLWGWPMLDVRPVRPAAAVRGDRGFWEWEGQEAA